MSIGHMPEPLDTLTSKTPAVHNAEALSGAAAEAEQGADTARPTDLMAQIAEIIEEQADLIAQKLVYTSQQMYGVSAVGVDFVNARNSALAMAKALRSGVLNHA